MRFKDFQGFRFGNIHSSDLNLEVVNSSNRYEVRTLPNPRDVAVDIAGSDGQYLFGSTYQNREITVNVAFDSVSEENYRQIKQLFATDTPQNLVFDEEPYKTWKAKIKSKPEFKSLCFTDRDTGKRVYKGDGKLVFICYSPYAFGFDKYVVCAADYYTTTPPETILCELSNEDNEIFIHAADLPAGVDPLPKDIKYHYNSQPHVSLGWEPNDEIRWKGGFPTIEQVQAGELCYDATETEKSGSNTIPTILDARGYWKNIPEWETTAKLLTTPTLDYEQELMYMPQYSKINYINMETGFEKSRPMIGSRLLVYNPGDLPIDWELKMEINNRGFWSRRGGRFRVRRFNVERLDVNDAVDWCRLTTYYPEDDQDYMYENRYFKRHYFSKQSFIERIERQSEEQSITNIYKSNEDWSAANPYYSLEEITKYISNGIIPTDKQWDEKDDRLAYYNTKNFDELLPEKQIELKDSYLNYFNLHLDFFGSCISDSLLFSLGKTHPKHCYYAEPIPKEKLGHYIKLFYWQTLQINPSAPINFEDGITLANEYEEKMKDEPDEQKQNEIYWETLKALIEVYGDLQPPNTHTTFASDLFYQFINNPLEYIDKGLLGDNYDEETFNGYSYPAWIASDYLEIDAEKLYGVDLIKEYMAYIGSDIESIFSGHLVKYEANKIKNNIKLYNKMNKLLNDGQYLNDLLNSKYFLNSETRMLYSTVNPVGDLYHYKPIKNIMNQAIVKGAWFKLPPGWSLITIEPIVDCSLNESRKWLDARPFDWGYGGDIEGHDSEAQQLYDYIYKKVSTNFLEHNGLYNDDVIPEANRHADMTNEEKLRFNMWYQDYIDASIKDNQPVLASYYYHKRIIAEFNFLNEINIYWQDIAPFFAWTQKKGLTLKVEDAEKIQEETKDLTPYLDYTYDANGKLKRVITGTISDWWWYACNYMWVNFPPLYWAAADCFNDIKIKYTPLFY